MPAQHFTGYRVPTGQDAADATAWAADLVTSGRIMVETETLDDAEAIRLELDRAGVPGTLTALVTTEGVTWHHPRRTRGGDPGREGWGVLDYLRAGASALLSGVAEDDSPVALTVTHIYRNSGHAYTPAETPTAIAMDQPTGYYLITAHADIHGDAPDLGRVFVAVHADGAERRAAGTAEDHLTITTGLALNAASRVEVVVFHELGGPRTVTGGVDIVEIAPPAWRRV